MVGFELAKLEMCIYEQWILNVNIFLVGPMGAGKSTVGRQLARELKLKFIDTDREIEDRSGADIPWIFDMEGEAGFRKREANIVAELTELRDVVMATGGGAVETPENRQHLSARGTVIYLYATVDQQVERTSKDKNRPLLQNEDPRQVLEDLFDHRHPLYEEVADITVATGAQNPRTLAADIIKQIEALRSL